MKKRLRTTCNLSEGIMSETKSKSTLNDLQQYKIQRDAGSKLSRNKGSDEPNLGLAPGRKRIQIQQDSDSENEATAQVEKKIRLELSVEEKEKRFVSARKIEPDYDPMDMQDSLLRCNWDVSKAIRYLKEHYSRTRKSNGHSHHSNGTSKHHHHKSKSSRQEDVEDDKYMKAPVQMVYDSDEDSDTELSNEMTPQRQDVFDFMNNATMLELLTVKKCSEKKVAAIMELRPFASWADLRKKFETYKTLSADILNNCQDLLMKRNNIANIMVKCKRLVKRLETAVASGGGITEQPSILNENFKLAEYQLVGLNWLAIMHKEQMNGILADEMGLGKTIQVIAFLAYLKEKKLSKGCHLIVVPASTLDNWHSELTKWCPSLIVEKYYGGQDERRVMRMKYAKEGFKGLDVLLTTYHTVGSTPEERKMFRVTKIHYVIFDEAHMLKNMTTNRYSQLITINAEMRILLTGTPLQNNLLELMSLLCFVMPSFFARNTDDIKSLFQKKSKTAEDASTFEQKQIEQARKIMKPFVLRRLKVDVLKYLPKKTEHIVKVPMSAKQKEHYKELVDYYSNSKGVVSGTNEYAGITIMMEMRKLANHPLLMRYYYSDDDLKQLAKRLAKCSTYKGENTDYIFEDIAYLSDFQIWQLCEKHDINNMDLPDDVILNSGKFAELDKLLPKLKEGGHRTLIFSQFTMMLDIVERYLDIKKYQYLRLDGSTMVTERQELIDEFNENPEIFIFLLSTKAGGMGINLTAADTAIIHDIDFNPYNDKQAEDRCHRMGQTKPVTIYRFISEGTIEEGVLMVAQEKLNLEKEINSEGDDKQEHKCMVRLLTMALGMDEERAETLLKNGSPSKDF